MTRIQTIAVLALFACVPASAYGQFDLDWYTIDGGGAMSTSGGAFELSGTIGQPDAGSFAQPMTGGPFELVGGFWPVAVGGVPCPADLDGNGQIALSDLTILLSNFGATGATPQQGDINGDTVVNLADLTILLSQFGTVCP